MRLALYAHYSTSGTLARYVVHYLRQLRALGFQICFVSNSPIPPSGALELREICERVIERENTGYDFAMWQRGLTEYDLSHCHELLLTNSSIVGPLHPLGPLWQRVGAIKCDFWGLTDNDDLGDHLQSYFLVFRRQALEHPCFQIFWSSILPYRDKQTVIGSYEIGLTKWLEQHNLKWISLFPQKDIQATFLSRLTFVERLKDRIFPIWRPQNTTVLLPDLLLERGMPFLKVALLRAGGDLDLQIGPDAAFRLLASSSIPKEVLGDLHKAVG
jgi:lipopolysaccharide biosynthesis protein